MQNKTTFIVVTITVIFLLEVMVKRKTCVFQRKLTEEEETEGGRVRWCELDEEKKAETGEGREKSINVNIVAKAMCFKHKGAHHLGCARRLLPYL